jgi:hypothetical protein
MSTSSTTTARFQRMHEGEGRSRTVARWSSRRCDPHEFDHVPPFPNAPTGMKARTRAAPCASRVLPAPMTVAATSEDWTVTLTSEAPRPIPGQMRCQAAGRSRTRFPKPAAPRSRSPAVSPPARAWLRKTYGGQQGDTRQIGTGGRRRDPRLARREICRPSPRLLEEEKTAAHANGTGGCPKDLRDEG